MDYPLAENIWIRLLSSVAVGIAYAVYAGIFWNWAGSFISVPEIVVEFFARRELWIFYYATDVLLNFIINIAIAIPAAWMLLSVLNLRSAVFLLAALLPAISVLFLQANADYWQQIFSSKVLIAYTLPIFLSLPAAFYTVRFVVRSK